MTCFILERIKNKATMDILEKIYDLEPEQSELLYSEEVDGQRIEVRQWQHYRWLTVGGESIQTLVDLNNIEQIMLPNLKVMLSALFLITSPKRLLNLGMGGASFERYLEGKRPEIKLTSVESNEKVIQLAKQYFFLPEQTELVHSNAEHFVSVCRDNYDIILCDIFAHEKQPACLYDPQFFADAFNCLTGSGAMTFNLLPESEEDVINMLLPMKDYFNQISLIEIPNHYNVILIASRCKLPEERELNILADELFKKMDLDLRNIPGRIHRLMEMIQD